MLFVETIPCVNPIPEMMVRVSVVEMLCTWINNQHVARVVRAVQISPCQGDNQRGVQLYNLRYTQSTTIVPEILQVIFIFNY